MPIQMIGNDNGNRFKASGNHATSAMSTPTPVMMRMYGSGAAIDNMGTERPPPAYAPKIARISVAALHGEHAADVRNGVMTVASTLLNALVATALLTGCAGHMRARNTDFSRPDAPAIVRSLELRDRYGMAVRTGQTAIFVDSVAVHHVHAEASTIVWKDASGNWQWSQVSETGPGGLLPMPRKLEFQRTRTLSATDSATLDRLIADRRLYDGKARTQGTMGVGAPGHVMSIVTPYGRTTVSWYARLVGVSGQVADIVLGRG